MLEIRNLRQHNLQPVSLTVPNGQALAVTGPSGSGKTLFLRAVADLDPNEGSIRLDGLDRTETNAPQWRRQVVYVPADPAWWADDVGTHFSDVAAAVQFTTAMGLHEDVFEWPINRLSTGERQRLGLARALALSPRCLLLDEPTSGLDDGNRAQVETIITEQMSRGTICFIVTHDREQARRLAPKNLHFEQGRSRLVAE